MEWYFGSDGDDLVVPKDQEQFDRLPSPNSWSDWGISEFPSKNSIGRSFSEEVDINISGREMECSSNSNISNGLHSNLDQWATLSSHQPDYELDDIARMDQMNDIYMNSLLDEGVATDNLYGSSGFSPQSQYSMMSADNLSTDRMLESDYDSSHTYGVGGSKYVHAFSPTLDCGARDVATSRPSRKAPVFKDSAPSEHENEKAYMHEESSPEESVLQELERVTAKLTAKTRNFFRDSLYRLAENSKKQTVNPVQNGDLVEKCQDKSVHDDTLRVGETEARESKTNAIDRAIANLMFTKMDFFTEESPAASSDFEREAKETMEQFQHDSSKSRAPCFTMLAGDAEVPIIGK